MVKEFEYLKVSQKLFVDLKFLRAGLMVRQGDETHPFCQPGHHERTDGNLIIRPGFYVEGPGKEGRTEFVDFQMSFCKKCFTGIAYRLVPNRPAIYGMESLSRAQMMNIIVGDCHWTSLIWLVRFPAMIDDGYVILTGYVPLFVAVTNDTEASLQTVLSIPIVEKVHREKKAPL